MNGLIKRMFCIHKKEKLSEKYIGQVLVHIDYLDVYRIEEKCSRCGSISYREEHRLD